MAAYPLRSLLVICPSNRTGIDTCLKIRVLRVQLPSWAPNYVWIAQLEERGPEESGVVGSIPTPDTKRSIDLYQFVTHTATIFRNILVTYHPI